MLLLKLVLPFLFQDMQKDNGLNTVAKCLSRERVERSQIGLLSHGVCHATTAVGTGCCRSTWLRMPHCTKVTKSFFIYKNTWSFQIL